MYRKDNLRTLDGDPVTIIHPGELNRHAGPDFFNAMIRIGRIIWAGNVEVHHLASDWSRHGHHLDPLYNNVILHVIRIPDDRACNSLGRDVQGLVIDYPGRLEETYRRFEKSDDRLPCSLLLHTIPRSYISVWLKSLFRERLLCKSGRIIRIHGQNDADWEKTLYISLACGYGLPVNLLPFEMLAAGLPLRFLMEVRDDRIALEALLFGQAGFLDPLPVSTPLVIRMNEIYRDLQVRLCRPPIPRYLWKFLRLRPASFPTLRISQFAGLVQNRFPVLHDILNPITLPDLEQMFRTRASSYWENHYRFGRISPPRAKYTGNQCVRSLIINAVVPFLYAYARKEKERSYLDLCSDILKQVEAESNHIIKRWMISGIIPADAFETQALIQLYKHYCLDRRCLECWLGRWCVESSL